MCEIVKHHVVVNIIGKSDPVQLANFHPLSISTDVHALKTRDTKNTNFYVEYIKRYPLIIYSK
jgi:hypothetical protein